MFTNALKRFKKLTYYFSCSCLSAILDFFIATTLLNMFLINYMIANTIGIIAGFILHFIVSGKAVFMIKLNIKSFTVYFITFLIGLLMANIVIWASYEIFSLSFNISKFLSMALPFFIIYLLRTASYRLIEGFEHDEQRV